MNKILSCILFLLIAWGTSSAQTPLSNQRIQRVAIKDLPQALDSLTVIPNSLEVWTAAGARLDSSFYELKAEQLHWLGPPSKDSLELRFRVLPYDLDYTLSHLDTTRIELAPDGTYIGFDFRPYEEDEEKLIDFKGLNYNGSFARGVSFGNTQNLVLNSSFNLQLAGKLGNDVEILAAITDNNIPLQPEGNTQQLQEFDRIFIQLKRRNTSLIAGDYELARPNSHFMNYFKKLQGATFSHESDLGDNKRLSTKMSVAISRGKFARNIIQQQEGNQGPYQLQGAEGERFIIVEAGTEKIFIDGQIMIRGLDGDYIIDYNRAEIIFTNKRLITKDSRIIAEFEYSVQTYLRSLYAVNTEYQSDKMRLYFNLYSEQDSKTSGGARDLDSLERQILNDVGDDLSAAFAPGIDTLEEFSEFRISYKQVDTSFSIQGIPAGQTILVYTTNKDSARFTANFLEVGSGNGDYVIDGTTGANGRVFRWVAPDPNTGIRQGNYTPAIRLIAPNQLQLMTAGGEFQLSKNSYLKTELAFSHNDPNRFSSIGNDNNTGLALFTNFRDERQIGKTDNGWKLETEANYEMVQETFKALNPYRNAEFNRDWNISQVNNNSNGPQQPALEHLGNGGMTIVKSGYGQLKYQFGGYVRQGLYNGTRHVALFQFKRNGYDVRLEGNWLFSDSERENTRFSRPRVELSKTFKQLNNWKIGFYGERERNQRQASTSDTLSNNSFYYDLYRIFLQSPENNGFRFGANYQQRYDYLPRQADFGQATVADEFNLNGGWQQGRNSRLGWNLTYRKLVITDNKLIDLDPQETFLGRIEHSLNLLKGVIRSNTNYELGSGQERKLEFQYLPVAAGEGVYTWVNDLNGDSIPQINEIEEAVFQNDANIVRVSLFTDEFIRTNNVEFNQSLRLEPRSIWYRKKGIKKFISRFSTQSTVRISRKTREAEGVSAWNPFQLAIADTSLVSITSGIRNTLFFNRSNPKYDLQFGQLDNRNKVVLTSGFESRTNQEYFFRARWNITQKFTTIINLAQGTKQNDSEFFDNRDFNIEFQKIEPQLSLLPSQNFRNIFNYKFQKSTNTLGGETAVIQDFGMETTYNQSNKTSLRLDLSFVRIRYDGSANSSLEFAMLEGLRDGANYLWNVSLDRRLARNIQLNISYEGRRSGDNPTVHVGRAQVRASF